MIEDLPLHNWIHTKYIPTADSSWYTSESGHFQEWSETVVPTFLLKPHCIFDSVYLCQSRTQEIVP